MTDLIPYITYAISAVAAYGVYRSIKFLTTARPLANLRGPPSPSFLLGHNYTFLKAVESDAIYDIIEGYIEEYGSVFGYRDFFNEPAFQTTDLRAISHVLMHPDIYHKPDYLRDELIRLMGEGVLVTEGPQHRNQRRLMNPAFGPGQVRDLTGIFLDKANELREKWNSKIGSDRFANLDITLGLNAVTLDIIGAAGFDYEFNSLSRSEDDPSELSDAFHNMDISASGVTLWSGLAYLFPILHRVPTPHNNKMRKYRDTMDRVGRDLLQRKKAEVAQGQGKTASRDLISLLVRANIESDTAHRLSDDDMLAQIPIFLLAGHDTSANALAFLLFEISQRPDLQVRLREELLSLPLSTASSENSPMTQEEVSKLEKLPLLDAVLRETLRLHPPVGSTIRAAVQDDVIPVVEHYTDKQGRMHDSIPVKKGDLIPIHILIANRSKEIWGEDARQWNPDRWLNGIPETAKAVPGIYGPLLTFINGSHACIGWRFALIEMKVILHVLLSSFNFKLGVDPSNVGKVSTGLVLRPIMNSAREKGAALPLVISRAAQD